MDGNVERRGGGGEGKRKLGGSKGDCFWRLIFTGRKIF